MTDAEKKVEKQIVFLVGPSHNGNDGDRRSVSPEVAKSLVDRGLARYPANHPASE